jgi:hypothetical protein
MPKKKNERKKSILAGPAAKSPKFNASHLMREANLERMPF